MEPAYVPLRQAGADLFCFLRNWLLKRGCGAGRLCSTLICGCAALEPAYVPLRQAGADLFPQGLWRGYLCAIGILMGTRMTRLPAGKGRDFILFPVCAC